MEPPLAKTEALERFDRNVITSALDGRHLPPYVPLEPSGAGASEGAARIVPVALDALREAHGVRAWTPETFETAFLPALRAWHGALEVEREGATLRTLAAACPVAAQAAMDARVCQMCRAFHAFAAQEAYGLRLRGVTFPRLVTRGDAACEMRLAIADA